MPITAKQVNEDSGSSEAKVARDRTRGAPKMKTTVAGSSSEAESQSDKSWSRSAEKNQRERARR